MSEPMRSGGVPGAGGRRPDETVLRLARDEGSDALGPVTGQLPVTGPVTGQVPVTSLGRNGRRGARVGGFPLDALVAIVIAVIVVAVVLFVLFGLRR